MPRVKVKRRALGEEGRALTPGSVPAQDGTGYKSTGAQVCAATPRRRLPAVPAVARFVLPFPLPLPRPLHMPKGAGKGTNFTTVEAKNQFTTTKSLLKACT